MAPPNCQAVLLVSLFSFIIFNSAQAISVPRDVSMSLPSPSPKSSVNARSLLSKLEPPPMSRHPELSQPEQPPLSLPNPGTQNPQGPPLSQSPHPISLSKKVTEAETETETEPEPDQGSTPDSPSDNQVESPSILPPLPNPGPQNPQDSTLSESAQPPSLSKNEPVPDQASALDSPSDNPPSEVESPPQSPNIIGNVLQPIYPDNVDPGIKQICDSTDYPDICITAVVPSLQTQDKNDLTTVLGTTMRASKDMANVAMSAAEKSANAPGVSPENADSLSVCKNSYDDAMNNFQKAMEALPDLDTGTMNTMLSAVITNVGDCQDAFEGQTSPVSDYADKLHKMASNSLAMVSLCQ